MEHLSRCTLAYQSAGIENLYPNFATAVAVLRVLRHSEPKLAERYESSEELRAFYLRLNEIEKRLYTCSNAKRFHPRLIAVEGLDGTGKSTIAAGLAAELKAQLVSTPPKSMLTIRKFFDSIHGAASRAYYMLSNYVLADEMQAKCDRAQEDLLFVTDRFYSSTCAYTIGTSLSSKPTNSVAKLPSHLFCWPHDLLKPIVAIILQVPHAIRERRVLERGNSDEIVAGNTWEDRLRRSQKLGQDIIQVYLRVQGPNIVSVNATGSRQHVLQMVLGECKKFGFDKKITSFSRYLAFGVKRSVVLVLLGTHCAGKKTIGMMTAQNLGWKFHEELGCTLRSHPVDQYLHPDGGASTPDGQSSWDNRVRLAETRRDADFPLSESRCVETWHTGNLAWALLRKSTEHKQLDERDRQQLTELATHAITLAKQRGHVIVHVFLSITVETMLRRRLNDSRNKTRVPFAADSTAREEAERLHHMLGAKGVETARTVCQACNIRPPVVIPNNVDGEEARKKIVNDVSEIIERAAYDIDMMRT